MGGCGGYPRNMNMQEEKPYPLYKKLWLGVVWDLYTATFPSSPPSSTYLSLSLPSIPRHGSYRGLACAVSKLLSCNHELRLFSISYSHYPPQGRERPSRGIYPIKLLYTNTLCYNQRIYFISTRKLHMVYTMNSVYQYISRSQLNLF